MDLLIVPPIIVVIIACAVRLHRFRHARIRTGITHGRGTRAETTVLWVLVPGLALIVLFHVALFSSPGPVSNPAPSQVTGTWIGAHGATLVVRADGTFTASNLPATLDQADNVGIPSQPVKAGSGTWEIGGPYAQDQSYVSFTFGCASDESLCGASFELQLQGTAPPGLFYYIGDPDDDNTYVFARQ